MDNFNTAASATANPVSNDEPSPYHRLPASPSRALYRGTPCLEHRSTLSHYTTTYPPIQDPLAYLQRSIPLLTPTVRLEFFLEQNQTETELLTKSKFIRKPLCTKGEW